VLFRSITGITSTAGLYVGMQISGTNIPAGSFVTAINSPTAITINQNVTAATPGTQALTVTASLALGNGVLTQNSTSITGITSTAGLYVGMQISGTNIPGGSFITAINSATAITINQNVTAGNPGTQALTVTADSAPIRYGLRIGGTTTLLGDYAIINTATAGPGGRVELAGALAGAGNLVKLGAGGLDTQRNLIISGNANSGFTGGIDIQQGMVQVTATSGSPLGTAQVRVYPGAALRLAGNGSLNAGATLRTLSQFNSLGTVVLDGDFTPSVLTTTNFSSAYGVALALARPMWDSPLNLAAIGDGRAILQGLLNTEVNYLAPTLGVGAGNTYRIAGGPNSTFVFGGSDNVLTGTARLEIGQERANWLGGAQTGTAGNVTIRNSNNFSGGTTIFKGMTLTLETGAAPGGSTPLGSGVVEVFGTLQLAGDAQAYNGSASFVNAATGANANSFILRPGGQIIINDQLGSVAGGEGRWDDATGIDLNGGTFRFNGASSAQSVETIGDLTVSKGGQITFARANSGSTRSEEHTSELQSPVR
jgi:hypothetical protein